MGRNEIRLRRNMMSTGRIARHRNYSEVMRLHERDTKLRRIFKAFTYFLVILFIIIILIIVIRWENRKGIQTSNAITELAPKLKNVNV